MNAAIIPAAGRGTRMSSSTSKQFLLLAGRPVLAHTLAAFEAADSIDIVIVVGMAKDLKDCREQVVDYTFDRGEMWAIQTPQAFRAEVLIQAHRVAKQAHFYGTDDATLVEKINHPVRVIPGPEENIKITTPIDMVIAEAVLMDRQRKSV